MPTTSRSILEKVANWERHCAYNNLMSYNRTNIAKKSHELSIRSSSFLGLTKRGACLEFTCLTPFVAIANTIYQVVVLAIGMVSLSFALCLQGISLGQNKNLREGTARLGAAIAELSIMAISDVISAIGIEILAIVGMILIPSLLFSLHPYTNPV